MFDCYHLEQRADVVLLQPVAWWVVRVRWYFWLQLTIEVWTVRCQYVIIKDTCLGPVFSNQQLTRQMSECPLPPLPPLSNWKYRWQLCSVIELQPPLSSVFVFSKNLLCYGAMEPPSSSSLQAWQCYPSQPHSPADTTLWSGDQSRSDSKYQQDYNVSLPRPTVSWWDGTWWME